MAGQPERRAWHQRISAEYGEFILECLERGDSFRAINVRIKDKYEEQVGEATLRRWADQDENRQAVAQARARAADAKAEGAVDRATDLVRDVALGLRDKNDIAAAKLASDMDKWIAGVWNRDKYGEQTQAGVTINVTSLHLDSLRTLETPSRPAELGHGRAKLMGDVVDVEPTQLSDLI